MRGERQAHLHEAFAVLVRRDSRDHVLNEEIASASAQGRGVTKERTLSYLRPRKKCSTFLTNVYGVKISMIPCTRLISSPPPPNTRTRTHEVVDDAKILVIVSRRSDPSLVLVEQEHSPLGRILLGKLDRVRKRLGVGPLNRLAQRRSIRIPLDLRRLSTHLDGIRLRANPKSQFNPSRARRRENAPGRR